MAQQDQSRQQSADRSQSGASAQPGGSQATRTAQQGSSTQVTRSGDRQGGAQSRYGVPSRRAMSGYDVTPFTGAYGGGPFTLMRRISDEMDRLLESFGLDRSLLPDQGRGAAAGGQGLATVWSPRIDITERDNKLVIQAELPGLRGEDVNVQIEPDAVIIQGERRDENERSDKGRYVRERFYGTFYRMIPLPEGVDVDQANATFRNGVLEIELPLGQQQRGRRVEVREDSGTSGGSSASGSSSGGTASSSGTSGASGSSGSSGSTSGTR
jgi:HSP20 family protein